MRWDHIYGHEVDNLAVLPAGQAHRRFEKNAASQTGLDPKDFLISTNVQAFALIHLVVLVDGDLRMCRSAAKHDE